MSQKPATHCRDCNMELNSVNSVYLGGRLKNRCRNCYNIRQTEWRKNNPESKSKTRRGTTLKVYGITIEEYDNLSQKQGGVCAICKNENGVEGRSLAVDHCHATNIVRGLLCHNCNVALGLLNEDETIISNLLEYIKNYRDKHDFRAC